MDSAEAANATNIEIMLQNAVTAVMEREKAKAQGKSTFTLAFMAEVHRRCASIYEAEAIEAEAQESADE